MLEAAALPTAPNGSTAIKQLRKMTAGKENEPRRKLALTRGDLGFLLTEDSTL